MTRLSSSFYGQPTLRMARDLIGKVLVRWEGGIRLAGRIVETEAYVGESDLACHASRGRTPRTEVMFGPPGHAYVYLVYGIHCCLNVVSERAGFPAAVLIRALEPLEGTERMRRNRGGRPDREIASGPGKLCQALAVDRSLNGVSLVGPRLWIEEGGDPADILFESPRIGVDYAGPDRDRPWRFFVGNNPHVSRHRFNRSSVVSAQPNHPPTLT